MWHGVKSEHISLQSLKFNLKVHVNLTQTDERLHPGHFLSWRLCQREWSSAPCCQGGQFWDYTSSTWITSQRLLPLTKSLSCSRTVWRSRNTVTVAALCIQRTCFFSVLLFAFCVYRNLTHIITSLLFTVFKCEESKLCWWVEMRMMSRWI